MKLANKNIGKLAIYSNQNRWIIINRSPDYVFWDAY